jgi:two-component system C4-dicarboxylate transport response regulator DctD
MVVDDDKGVREFMAALLEMTGAEVARFSSAAAALTNIAATPEPFQFILTDLEMPGMNGLEFFRRARALAPDVKILLVTGNPVIDEAEVLRLGFCGLLRKPFPAEALQHAAEAVQTGRGGHF